MLKLKKKELNMLFGLKLFIVFESFCIFLNTIESGQRGGDRVMFFLLTAKVICICSKSRRNN